jgi:hypothetical protein
MFSMFALPWIGSGEANRGKKRQVNERQLIESGLRRD